MDWARAFFSIFPGRGQWVAAQIPSYGEISTQSGMTRHSPSRSPAQKGAVGGLPTPCARCGRGRREKGERSFVYERVFVRAFARAFARAYMRAYERAFVRA